MALKMAKTVSGTMSDKGGILEEALSNFGNAQLVGEDGQLDENLITSLSQKITEAYTEKIEQVNKALA